MSLITVNNNYIAVVKGLHVELYEGKRHVGFTVDPKSPENDTISDVVLSKKSNKLALMTANTKQLLVYELPSLEVKKTFVMPRSASKIRFTQNDQQILVADKSGDVLIYNIEEEDSGTKLLGHLSLLLDVLQTDNGKYIITSDRDEKIKVSCYPNTYNVQTYCLGHKEFVNHIELLPHNTSYLTSSSGDGQVKCWDYVKGKLCYNIDTYADVNDPELKEKFIKSMDTDGMEVDSLPIVHYAVTKLDNTSSLIAVVVYNYSKMLLYKLTTVNNEFSHTLAHKLELDSFPSAVQCHNSSLYAYNFSNQIVSRFNYDTIGSELNIKLAGQIKFFENVSNGDVDVKESTHEAIKVLYKRKFDNVQEYQERKRQRIEKSEKSG